MSQLANRKRSLHKENLVYTRQFEDIENAFNEAIEFIMEDLQHNICDVTCNSFGRSDSRHRCRLRCYKVLIDEPLAKDVIPQPPRDPLVQVMAVAVTHTLQEFEIFPHQIFSKTFFKWN